MDSQQTSLAQILTRLSQACFDSQESYAYAAQHTRNRGLKLVLKSYAQERAQFQEQLHRFAPESGPLGGESSGSALGRGWASMRAWFTVRRQSRQRMLMLKALQSDKAAITAYEDALRQQLPSDLMKLAREQLAAFYQAESRMTSFTAPRRDGALLVRLYERPEQVTQVVSALEGAGVQRDQVFVADVAQLSPYVSDKPDRERARWETMVAAALVGAVIGCVIILPFAIAQRIYFPQLNGLVADSPTGVLIEYLVGGALVGAIFGLYFSIFIGQDIVEDDAYFYEQSLESGKVLIAVPATPTNRADVERVLGLQHQFEVKPQTA